VSADEQASALERLRERLRLFAARRLRNWEEAEDVAQEAIRRAVQSLRAGKMANPDAMPAFLFQTVVHICQHRMLSAGRESRAIRGLASDGAEPEAPEEDPLQALLSEERRRAVREAMSRLDPSDRDVLSLSYVDALDAADVGHRLGLTPGNVRVRRHRALKRLKELLTVTPDGVEGLRKRE
jgi:RNA polymerase sigma-70 factor (ECF subfamily)